MVEHNRTNAISNIESVNVFKNNEQWASRGMPEQAGAR